MNQFFFFFGFKAILLIERSIGASASSKSVAHQYFRDVAHKRNGRIVKDMVGKPPEGWAELIWNGQSLLPEDQWHSKQEVRPKMDNKGQVKARLRTLE